MTEAPSRYSKPRVLLIDLPEAATESLRALGLNVKSGTFGPRYSVPVSPNSLLVETACELPDYEEQEIVVLDTSPTPAVPYPNDIPGPVDGIAHFIAQCGYGVIDTRPLAMARVREKGDRILESGGMFIIFCSRIFDVEYKFSAGGTRCYYEDIRFTNRDYLTLLGENYLSTEPNAGSEIREVDKNVLILSHIRRFLPKSRYETTFGRSRRYFSDDDYPIFIPLLLSKYGDTVGQYILANSAHGGVLILPQVQDKAGLLVELFKNYLPSVHAHLFPEHEGERWVHRPEYEHPAILEKVAHRLEIQRRADEEKAAIDAEIDGERARLAFLHGLLTKSGDELVADVKAALEFIGFERVVDVDLAEKDRGNKQEDLQILDRPTKVLVEVKGIGALPRESNTLQVTKFIVRRLRNWIWPGEPVVAPHGVTLVNHQRGMPPLDRDHKNVFTEPQVEDSKANGTGLMTTWDLFRLIRGMERWGWDRASVQDVFFGTGRVGERPSHYREVGRVARFLDKLGVVSVEVGDGMVLREGDTVGYVLADRFHEEVVAGLQVDKTAVAEAVAGQRGGFKTTLSKGDLPEGLTVFLTER